MVGKHHCLCPELDRQACMLKHRSCHLSKGSFLSLRYPILHRGVWSSRLVLDALAGQEVTEDLASILASSICPETLDCLASLIGDLSLILFELGECLILLFHEVEVSPSSRIVCEGDEIS